MPGGIGGVELNRTNERLSSSLSRYQKNIKSQVAKRKPLLSFLEKHTEKYDGGLDIAVQFRYTQSLIGEANSNVGVYSYYDNLTTAPTDQVKTGRETWSFYNAAITLSGQEQRENAGKNIFKRFKQKTMFAEADLATNINNAAWGVAGGDASKHISSIPSLISGSDAGTIHGLSKASNTWLYSQSSTAIGDAATNLLDKMAEGYNSCIDAIDDKSQSPDIAITQQAVYQVLQGILPNYLAIDRKGNEPIDIGFPQIKYMGVTLTFDSACPQVGGSYSMWMLTGSTFEYVVDQERNFITTPFVNMLPKQDADVAQILTAIGLTCNSPRSNWRGTGITISN